MRKWDKQKINTNLATDTGFLFQPKKIDKCFTTSNLTKLLRWTREWPPIKKKFYKTVVLHKAMIVLKNTAFASKMIVMVSFRVRFSIP